MNPRYAGPNRRYNVSKPKEKMPREKKLLIKSGICLVLFALLWTMSFFVSGDNVHKILYTTYNAQKWQQTFVPAFVKVRDVATDMVSAYIELVSTAEKEIGIKNPDKSAKEVKAADNKKEDAESVPSETYETALDWRPPLWSKVTSEFGERVHPITGEKSYHSGIDIAAEEGTPVVAAAEGVVSKVGYDEANGHYIIVEHMEGITTVYAHLRCSTVREGDAVSPFIKIAEAGNTGISTGPHLHFELKKDGESINPRTYVFFREG